MVARSVVTLGVSTERGAVHAVALADTGEKLVERVLVHRVAKTHGDSKADVAAAVQAAMDYVAAEVGEGREIAGAAVAYRDAAERRAIVTRLASGPWRTASLLSTKSAHLSAAGMMTWLGEFDDLLVCEVVPGHQAFTLVDKGRNRVLAAVSQTGGTNEASLGAAVTAAWDQFEAAAVRPDGVVLIGSAAEEPAVREAVDRFGAPVLPCKIASSAAAVGAALFAMADVPELVDTVEEERGSRSSAGLFVAASVVAAGLVVGGVFTLGDYSIRSVVADARNTADAHVVPGTGSSSGMAVGSSVQPEIIAREDRGAASVPRQLPLVTGDTPAVGPQTVVQRWGSGQDRPLTLEEAEALGETDTAAASVVPGTGIPSTTRVGAPNDAMLFPGEAPPPPAFTPESYEWWDNHLRLLAQWASQQLAQA
ncbi:hypothetical protein SAMN04244553_3295 [Nocardia amikacinitolerans]|uniref:Uncharacterized protein n=1 Tax=Nocardia amikacinitolerans TaxID=756689 RepID=A0A285LE77_9NOCA|nr:hypothetical protein SAMN04244553_3295 [Nocardia amikacinitolerans]